MPEPASSLFSVFEGWDGYQRSIIQAAAPLTLEQLAFRPASHLRSVGEVVRHIALAPVDWFQRMDAPGSRELAGRIQAWHEDRYGNRYVNEEQAIPIAGAADVAAELVHWLEASWQMIEQTLRTWTLEDLRQTYRHTWRGNTYAISRQWTIWRIMAHTLHHGGELALMLGMQGIEIFELGNLGGHIIEPPQVNAQASPQASAPEGET